ncbi:hypothetical protein M0R04_12610 [Candidatus Dojkabacteria bacterium]|jgi:hypothetical protein|nr:hypothetical protein [Candidatus Dojkabacteria bacterium]
MKEKKWYESSTLWINLLGVVAVVLGLVVDSNLIPDADVLAIITAVLNIINRFRVTGNVKVPAIEKSII